MELTGRLSSHLGVPEVELLHDMKLSSMQLDSIIAVTVLGELQDLLGIDIPVDLLWEKETLSEVAAHIHSLVVKKGK